MGWGQRNARFYCEIDSARAKTEKILGDKNSGISITVAGEHGSLIIRVWAGGDGKGGDADKFAVSFAPWRRSKNPRAESVLIAEGKLDFDAHKPDDVMVRLGKEVMEAFNYFRAKKVMTGEED